MNLYYIPDSDTFQVILIIQRADGFAEHICVTLKPSVSQVKVRYLSVGSMYFDSNYLVNLGWKQLI